MEQTEFQLILTPRYSAQRNLVHYRVVNHSRRYGTHMTTRPRTQKKSPADKEDKIFSMFFIPWPLWYGNNISIFLD